MRSALDTDGDLGRFAERILALDLPGLPSGRRSETVSFVCRRAAETPGPLRLGVIVLAVATSSASTVCGDDRVVAFMRTTRLPLVGELARMVRALAFAFVWESWPDTAPDGAPREDRV